MKIIFSFLITLTACYGLPAWSANQEFLKCLGAEELHYHNSKLNGAYQRLNQKIISEFIQLSRTLTIKDKYQKEVCKTPNSLPSLILLKLLLTKRESLFISSANKLDISQTSIDQGAMKEVTKEGFRIFVSFINDLQAMSNTPNCIIKKIPELKEFYFKSRYTMEDTGLRRLVDELGDLGPIFKKLNNKNILKDC